MAITASSNFVNSLSVKNLPSFRPTVLQPETVSALVARKIVKLLADNGVDVAYVSATPCYSYTQYWFRPVNPSDAPLCLMRKYLKDLETLSPRGLKVRFVYHPTENGIFGFEFVNTSRPPINYNQAVLSNVPGELCFAVGGETANNFLYDDLAEAGHLLVVGCERAGKTTFLQNLVLQLSLRYHSHHVRFILADCSKSSFGYFSVLPHSLTAEPLSDANDILASLKMLKEEVEERLQILRNGGYVNVAQYNRINKQNNQNILPHLVFVMDEVMPLMQLSNKILCELLSAILPQGAQVGVHLVLSTCGNALQVFPRSVLSGFSTFAVFKTNYPQESMFLLGDEDGTLLGCEGDMLYRKGKLKPMRVWGMNVGASHRDIYRNKILISCDSPAYERVRQAIFFSERLEKDVDWKYKDVDACKLDRLCRKATDIWLQSGKVTASSLIISLHINYSHACEIVEQLLKIGVICKVENSDSMQMVATQKDLERLFYFFEA